MLYFIEIGGLKQTDAVLDVGCGIGRMAVPLTKYLSANGSYVGIDIVPSGITWCTKKITPKFPNFKFYLIDVFNKFYNPKGKLSPLSYQFPFNDESFDFVFLTSVFTHMLPQDMEHYLAEISRVLRKNGKCQITFFLLNQDSLSHIEKKQSILDFRYNYENCLTINPEIPEDAIAYSEEFVRSLYSKYNLEIIEPIHYGSWCGREKFLSFQDIITCKKR